MYKPCTDLIDRLKHKSSLPETMRMAVHNPTDPIGVSTLKSLLTFAELSEILDYLQNWLDKWGSSWYELHAVSKKLSFFAQRFDKGKTGLARTFYLQYWQEEIRVILETNKKIVSPSGTGQTIKNPNKVIFTEGGHKKGQMSYRIDLPLNYEFISLKVSFKLADYENLSREVHSNNRMSELTRVLPQMLTSPYKPREDLAGQPKTDALGRVLQTSIVFAKAIIHAPFVPNLWFFLRKNKDNRILDDIITQIIGILEDLHRSGVIFQDIKMDNFLYDEKNNKVYLTDFANAQMSDDQKMAMSSFFYESPELLLYYLKSTQKKDKAISTFFNTQMQSKLSFASTYYTHFEPPLADEKQPIQNGNIPDKKNDIWALAIVIIEVLSNKRFAKQPKGPVDLTIPKELYADCLKSETTGIPCQFTDFLEKMLINLIPDSYHHKSGIIPILMSCLDPSREQRASIEEVNAGWKACLDKPSRMVLSQILNGPYREDNDPCSAQNAILPIGLLPEFYRKPGCSISDSGLAHQANEGNEKQEPRSLSSTKLVTRV